ncbi:unnamed protein product [Blepharisma stoltei]|uniref:Methyltransferase domain-containing protein n=1 Tax=Blepharisma stoltei TaxID=1481888 RepID=A0AAU9IL29_9CILI|nr:unnamed protein product [Blepharisma stoltei]
MTLNKFTLLCLLLELALGNDLEFKLQEIPSPYCKNSCSFSEEYLNLITFTVLARIRPSDKRYKTFLSALKLMIDRNSYRLIETGSYRASDDKFCVRDGCGTLIFSQFAFLTDREFTSIDIDQETVEISREAVSFFGDNTRLIWSDSIEYLSKINETIDFLYLDSFDYDENSPELSQEHHLVEIMETYNKLHKDSIILLDDCNLPYEGKCKLVGEFLVENGWEKVMDEYQRIYLHKDSFL